MKKYIVTGASLTTHKGLTYRNGDTVPESKLHPDHIADLIANKVIKEVAETKSSTTKTVKNEAV
jgi:hypothetical protein